MAPRGGTVVTVRDGSPKSKPRGPWRRQSSRERTSAIVAATPLPTPPRGRHPGDSDGEICDLHRIIVQLIAEDGRHAGHTASQGKWPTGNRPGPGHRYQEHRPPVRAVPALCACPGTQVAPPPRPPRDHGADGAAARQIPAPQHPERPAGGTRPRAGEGSDASRRPCFRRSDGTPAAHRSRPGS